MPSRYIDTILANRFEKMNETATLKGIKSMVKRTYARKYNNLENHLTAAFEEAWNSETSIILPSESLKRFNGPFLRHNNNKNSFYTPDDDTVDGTSNSEYSEEDISTLMEPKKESSISNQRDAKIIGETVQITNIISSERKAKNKSEFEEIFKWHNKKEASRNKQKERKRKD